MCFFPASHFCSWRPSNVCILIADSYEGLVAAVYGILVAEVADMSCSLAILPCLSFSTAYTMDECPSGPVLLKTFQNPEAARDFVTALEAASVEVTVEILVSVVPEGATRG